MLFIRDHDGNYINISTASALQVYIEDNSGMYYVAAVYDSEHFALKTFYDQDSAKIWLNKFMGILGYVDAADVSEINFELEKMI